MSFTQRLTAQSAKIEKTKKNAITLHAGKRVTRTTWYASVQMAANATGNSSKSPARDSTCSPEGRDVSEDGLLKTVLEKPMSKGYSGFRATSTIRDIYWASPCAGTTLYISRTSR